MGWHDSVRQTRLGSAARWATLAVATACSVLATPRPAWSGGGPENVAVVVNAASWASKAIANEYVHLRGIPSSHVIYIEGLKDFETTDVDTFREKILFPVMKTLFERNILEQIDIIAYSSDFPTAISIKRDQGKTKPSKIQGSYASLNGLTYLYQLVLKKDPQYLSLLSNFYMRRPVESVNSIPKTAEDRAAYVRANRLAADKQYEDAVTLLEPLVKKLPGNFDLLYNLACCQARLGRGEDAIKTLAEAAEAGWSNATHAQKDPDLETIRDTVGFKAALERMNANLKKPIEVQATAGFRSEYLWNDRGDKASSAGRRYMLSTMLAVTSGRGNSVSEAIDSLRRSVAADATQPRGTIYFMDNSDVRSTKRRRPFASAVKALESTPVQGTILKGKIPENADDVIGAMIGSASVQWGTSGNVILPGAICEHLTSFGGMMRETAKQMPLTEFIRYGAAGSSGTVCEPFAIQAKFPYAFMHVHYARGSSLAEAFYQAVFGPYQLLIVGDPLCQPWARRMKVSVDGVAANQPLAGKLKITPRVVEGTEPNQQLDHFQLFLDGRRWVADRSTRVFNLDTAKIADGWHELRVVAIAAGPLEMQSRMVLPLVVDNHGRRLALERATGTGAEVAYGKLISVKATASGARSIAVMHNRRTLATVTGESGTVRVDTRDIGLGQVTLYAATRLDGKTATSAPLELKIVPPPPGRLRTSVDFKGLSAGVALTLDRGTPIIIKEMKDPKWLSKQKPKTGQKLALDAYFSVDKADVYQFQVRGNSVKRFEVDGKQLWKTPAGPDENAGWVMVPVHLAKGVHRFQLQGTIAKSPTLEIRFGGRGCTSLNGSRFKH